MYGFVFFMEFETQGKAYMFLTFMTEDYNYYHEYTMAWIDGLCLVVVCDLAAYNSPLAC